MRVRDLLESIGFWIAVVGCGVVAFALLFAIVAITGGA